MQGSLDAPPVIVQSSRAKDAWGLLASAFIAGLGLADWLLTQTQPPPSVFLVTLLCAVGIPYFGWKLAIPDTLELSPQGLICKLKLSTRRFRWSEIDNFRAQTHYGSRSSSWQSVVFSCNPGDADRLYQVDLGNKWEIDNASLAKLLSEAGARWR